MQNKTGEVEMMGIESKQIEVHFFRQRGMDTWVEIKNMEAIKNSELGHIFEYRTLYAEPIKEENPIPGDEFPEDAFLVCAMMSRMCLDGASLGQIENCIRVVAAELTYDNKIKEIIRIYKEYSLWELDCAEYLSAKEQFEKYIKLIL